MSAIGIVGVCFALMGPTGAVDMKTEKCFYEAPIKFTSMQNCHAGSRIIISMGIRNMYQTYYPKYTIRRAGYRVVAKAYYRCSAT